MFSRPKKRKGLFPDTRGRGRQIRVPSLLSTTPTNSAKTGTTNTDQQQPNPTIPQWIQREMPKPDPRFFKDRTYLQLTGKLVGGRYAILSSPENANQQIPDEQNQAPQIHAGPVTNQHEANQQAAAHDHDDMEEIMERLTRSYDYSL